MRNLVFITLLVFAGCASNEPKQNAGAYVSPAERKLFDPKIIDGELVMPRDQWFHNFKAGSIPGLCNNPQAGFLHAYKGVPEECEKIVEKILDFCLIALSGKYIPEEIRGVAQANSYGQSMGSCLLINYQHSEKNT